MTRDAAAIGAGLAPARPARPIPAGQRLHVIGVAGAGASAAALLAHHAGALVTGCDAGGASPYTPPLEEAGVRLDWQHSADHITSEPGPDRVAVTKALTAVHADHPELRAAIEAGIPLESWQQAVADAAVGRTLVGVAGTHGKSTTAGWLVHVLVNAGLDPAAFVGALLPSPITGGLPSTARTGRGAPFVVEADEYAGNFDPVPAGRRRAHERRVGPPRRLRRFGRGHRCLRDLAAADAGRRHDRRQCRRHGRRSRAGPGRPGSAARGRGLRAHRGRPSARRVPARPRGPVRRRWSARDAAHGSHHERRPRGHRRSRSTAWTPRLGPSSPG